MHLWTSPNFIAKYNLYREIDREKKRENTVREKNEVRVIIFNSESIVVAKKSLEE